MNDPVPAKADILEFEALPGWAQDDHLAALKTFLTTCSLLPGDDWPVICRVAQDAKTSDAAARDFFEMFFKPVVIGNTRRTINAPKIIKCPLGKRVLSDSETCDIKTPPTSGPHIVPIPPRITSLPAAP